VVEGPPVTPEAFFAGFEFYRILNRGFNGRQHWEKQICTFTLMPAMGSLVS